MKQAPTIDAETLKNGVGNCVLFFVGLEGWKIEAWGVEGEARSLRIGVRLSPADRDNGFWCSGGSPPLIVGGKPGPPTLGFQAVPLASQGHRF